MPNPSRETKFSGTNADREIFIFLVQLTTRRTGNLTRLIHALAICVTILPLRFVAARDTETRRARQQQQANANAAAKVASKVQHYGNYNGGSRNAKYYSAVVLCTRYYNIE